MKAIILMLLLVACGGKKDSGSGDPSTGSATGSGTGSAMAGSNAGSGSDSAQPELTAAAPEAALPTEVDFEDDASARITEKNIAAELEAIEKQLTP